MKMQWGWRAVMVGLILLWAFPAGAQIYRYRDAQGNLRVTDNLGDVPEDQRPQIEDTQEIPASPPPAAAAAETGPGASQAEAEAEDPQAAEDAEIARLEAERAALEMMHQELLTAKAALEKEQAGLSGLAGRSVTAQKALTAKINDYNLKLEDYNQRNKAYEKQSQALLERQVAPPPPE
jgi:hypothetical protein